MRPIRFIQSSDFHLERLPSGLAEVPDHLRELLIESPYRAANNVFDLALRHEVDFVLLAGDLLDPHQSGPRGCLFLVQQFNRLVERGIEVYWLGGQAEQWSDCFEMVDWPANVHRFSMAAPTRFVAMRQGRPCAELIGHSYVENKRTDTDFVVQHDAFERSHAGLLTIGMLYGDLSDDMAEDSDVDYWALGGEHDATLPIEASPIVHYSGSPQGRSPAESGSHGCTLVQVDEQGHVQTTPYSTDVVRFLNERIVVDANTSRIELERQLRERLQSLIDTQSTTLIITWTIATKTPDDRVSWANHVPELLGILRGEFGHRSPAAWSLSITVERPSNYPTPWLEQETLLGDFLRAAHQYENDAIDPPDLNAYMPANARADLLERVRLLRAGPTQRRVLHEAAWLGASLLSSEEAEA